MLRNIQEHISAELENRVTLLDPQLDPRERVGKTPRELRRVPPPIARAEHNLGWFWRLSRL
jgi:hypothetical protein